jgi:hypothetical protein
MPNSFIASRGSTTPQTDLVIVLTPGTFEIALKAPMEK